MQIIIEIPNSKIPKQQDFIEIPLHFIDGTVCEAGGYGFNVLPKGHGRLIDADEAIKILKSLGNRDYRREKGTIKDAEKMLSYDGYIPTIIEADTESEDKK
jgi:hypothetical protein